jgi:hypothetical protein
MHGKNVEGGAFKLELFDGINVFVSSNELIKGDVFQ